MPVLARTFEAAGLSTVLVTMMPFWAQKIGTPRTLALEFPFGQTLGQPGQVDQQRRVILEALKLLENAKNPGVIKHSLETWNVPTKEAVRRWQPEEPSPIIAELTPKIRQILRDQRKSNN